MITWKLWAALHQPPSSHPLFKYVSTTRLSVSRWRGLLIVVICLVFSYLGYQISFRQTTVQLILLSLTLQDVVVMFVAFNLVYGCLLVAVISQTIARSREQGMYEVLCLIPQGASGITWTLGVGAVYRGRGFQWFRITILLVCGIPLIALAIHFVLPLLLWGGNLLNGTGSLMIERSYHQMLVDLANGLFLIGAFYTGCVQSVVLSVLVGMLIPASLRGSGTQIWAMGIFLLLQLTTCLLTFFFSLFFLPSIYNILHLSGWPIELSTPLWQFGFFFALREAVNLLLWRVLNRGWQGRLTFV